MRRRLAISVAFGVAIAIVAFAALAPGRDGSDAGDRGGPPDEVAWTDEGRRAYAAMGCGSCHRLAAAGSTGRIGPDLDERLAHHDRRSLRRAIVRGPVEAPGPMPDDYGDRLRDAELDALVSFLLAGRR